jgi:hypothetical protein
MGLIVKLMVGTTDSEQMIDWTGTTVSTLRWLGLDQAINASSNSSLFTSYSIYQTICQRQSVLQNMYGFP